ncbi:FecR family protein [Gramella sp. AN32]|uniref:FecR family protein n=1 Tax=Christiangramia antarctica TaxID=2058158 RepID=A0ABW5X7G8_9FLAO|nr:FecR family protein [Gramella sp. AN32]MCM4154744.1 anti-sigma factor [Gramella sp. AN32]
MKKNITKLLMGSISKDELIVLRKWLNDPENQSTLKAYIQDYHDLNLAVLKDIADEAYKKTVDQIERKEKPVESFAPHWIKYAAVAVLLIGLGIIFQQGFFSFQNDTLLVPQDEPITLQLDNGEIYTIDVSQSKEVRDSEGNILGKQKQHQLSYSQISDVEELTFNTLTIPYGKRFELVLSDGTLVHLNAGSSLRYPINFLSKGNREVYLSGEAYFDVAKDKSNPFVVNVDDLEVNVLGTEFNVSAYEEDSNIEVVLVEGAVSLSSNEASLRASTNLEPGQKGSFERTSNNMSIDQVNTSLYTSWREGHLVFRNLTFDQIMAKLERHYHIEIENENTELGKEVFNASFNDVKIEEVLSFFNDVHEINYKVKNNKVIIR